ncbi:hypothetical protein CEXT_696601 [Caerostris extrusa]|uniref:Peptidase S1 domain-containing protein n=1 Tax=Caerostris extrusa TaxID=172846 RepID=A0AAV4XHE5_CAEEX|nr:hypothetical protein CEXT_696601 [Caerostris extrusa]
MDCCENEKLRVFFPRPRNLREGIVTRTLDNSKCKRKKMSITICALGEEKNQTVCMGDSGSVAFQKCGHSWYGVGVVSSQAHGECDPSLPSYYSKVASHFDWIKRHARRLPKPQSITIPG